MATDPTSYPSEVGAPGDWERPNIVFVMADDLGWGDLGCYGQADIQTPELDQMAAEGLRCTDCYVGSPVCAPSRSVFATGEHAGHTRVRQNFGTVGGARTVDHRSLQRRVPLGPEDPSIAEVLSAAGYATGGFGKWGLGEPGTCGHPLRQGFDEWFGYLNQRRAHTYYPPFLWDGEERAVYPENRGDQQERHAQDLVMDRAADFIRRHQDERFFCYLPSTLPHAPYQAPDEESLAAYADGPWTDKEQAYAAMVSRFDRDIGRLLSLLDDLGLDEETMVFVCSDHGPNEPFTETFESNGPFQGGKHDLTEGGIRTPMVVRWPGQVPAGETCEAPWYYADVLPTLAEAAGLWPDPGHQAVTDADGLSVLPTLLGDEQNLAERYLYWEWPAADYGQAVRLGDWKGIRAPPTSDLALYDLAADPGETTDLADEHPDVVDRLSWFLDRAHEPAKHWPT